MAHGSWLIIQDHPLPAIDDLAHDVEMAGVAGGLGDDVQDDFA
jgi:hypothetical protein